MTNQSEIPAQLASALQALAAEQGNQLCRACEWCGADLSAIEHTVCANCLNRSEKEWT